MINIDDIKSGYTLGCADAEILRSMAKELLAYRKAFSEPAGWLLIDEERTNPGFTERELIKDLFMVIERHSHEPLYRKPKIPDQEI